jgi:NAD(P)-dependent dehydrogenase (short-subunit alcohol dehydrogenase family)
MKDFSGKVAVVTGAASGIGLAIAEKCVEERMKVVLADIEEDALELAADRLAKRGQVLAVPTDVSVARSVDDLRREAEALGPVFLLCSNAGVGGTSGRPAWQVPITEWQWVLEVNLWGVIHGLRTFLPGMVERNEGHVVNTASVAGLIPFPFATPYAASKHAVVGISISVHHELAMIGSRVHVSVLCPGMIRTRIADSDRNWLDRLGPAPEPGERRMLRDLIEAGMEPAAAATQVLEAVQAERFWVLPNAGELGPVIKDVAASAVEGRIPPRAEIA